MKLVTYRRYGGPEVLEYGDAPLPVPGSGEVLVRQRAASINALDYRLMRADPFLVRLEAGFFRPTNGKLGVDVAGVVEAVGPDVTRFRPGDEVLGECFAEGLGLGAFAEFTKIPEKGLALKPSNVSFEDAAALPLAGITALQP